MQDTAKKVSTRGRRKAQQAVDHIESRRRVMGWGRKKLRTWWKKKIRDAEMNNESEINIAKLRAGKLLEITENKYRFGPKVGEKKKDKQKVRKEKEFRRLKEYMEKCQLVVGRLESLLKLKQTILPITLATFELGKKYDHNKAEVERCKRILFGDLVSE